MFRLVNGFCDQNPEQSEMNSPTVNSTNISIVPVDFFFFFVSNTHFFINLLAINDT